MDKDQKKSKIIVSFLFKLRAFSDSVPHFLKIFYDSTVTRVKNESIN